MQELEQLTMISVLLLSSEVEVKE